MPGKAGHDVEGVEGQGEVIDVAVHPVPLTELDGSPELLQSGFWGSFKERHGWKARGFRVRAQGADFTLLVLSRELAAGLTIAYVPFGPTHDPGPDRGAMLSGLAQALRPHLPRLLFALRFDLPWARCGDAPISPGAPRPVKAPHDMQPASTVIVDIAPGLDAVLAGMKSKTRYNIRLAAKKGVTVEQGNSDDLEAWYAMYQETSRRDRIGIHSRAYYGDLLEAGRAYAGARPDVRLLLARHERGLLAGNIVAFWKQKSAYLYGASSNEKRNLMPTYALQWAAIRLAREAGCTTYDLFGVPPVADPRHPMFGLYQFKTGFSESIVQRWGTWDVPCRVLPYAGYRVAEAMRMYYYRRLKKRVPL